MHPHSNPPSLARSLHRQLGPRSRRISAAANANDSFRTPAPNCSTSQCRTEIIVFITLAGSVVCFPAFSCNVSMVVVFFKISSMWNFMKITMVTRIMVLKTKATTMSRSPRYRSVCPCFYVRTIFTLNSSMMAGMAMMMPIIWSRQVRVV